MVLKEHHPQRPAKEAKKAKEVPTSWDAMQFYCPICGGFVTCRQHRSSSLNAYWQETGQWEPH